MSRIHLNRDRQSLGQFTPEEVAEGLRSGRFLPTDLAWREGMETWQPLSTFTDLPEPGEIEPPTLAPGTPLSEIEKVTEGDPAGDFPWDKRGSIGLFAALWETLSSVLGSPAKVFVKLPASPDLRSPYLFYLPLALVTGVIATGLTAAFIKFAPHALSSMPEAASDPEVARLMVALRDTDMMPRFIGTLIGIPIAPFIAAAIYHALLMAFGGAREGFQKTFAVTCYVWGAVSPFQLVPCCGPFVQVIWGMISLSIGLAVAHRTDTWRAVLAVILALLIGCCGVMAFGFLASLSARAALPVGP